MSLKKKANAFRTVTFRLTLWYAVLFGSLSLAVFLVIYAVLTSSLDLRTNEDLIDTAKEFEALYSAQGIEALRAEIEREAESRGIKNVFFRFLSAQQEVLLTSDWSEWRELKTDSLHPAELSDGAATFETISVPKRKHRVRIASKKTSDGHVIQIGASLQENEVLMGKYRVTFGLALVAMLVCGSAVGRVLARRAMAGVERVTQTAVRIGGSDLARRVPLGNEGQEIDNLAQAFNAMLERIQALVREVKEVTNNIAHDLRSPITRMRGIAETTLTGDQNLDAYHEMAAAVVEESDRLVETINTMLEIAQTESGVAELSKGSVDLMKMIDDAVGLFQPVAEDKSIRLGADAPMEPLIVLGDVGRLQRVMANLLDNAIKYTPAGGEVRVSARATASQVIVEVVDTGVGIAEEDLPNIFNQFYRGDRSRSAPGSGLGLSLAHAIVRAHGGEISVRSSQDQGSTFTIVLPRISIAQ